MIQAPFGKPDTQAIATATGTVAVTVVNNMTVIDMNTTIGTGNRTLNLTLDSQLQDGGAEILVLFRTTGTETLTFGTGMLAPVITGVAGKIFSQAFILNGGVYYPQGTKVQCN